MRAFAGLILVLSSLIGGPARAGGWTFCVAESGRGRDIWITSVFPAARDHERLEVELKSYLGRRGIKAADAQCPAPKEDKTEMVNAQFFAAEFHRKLGDALHEVTAPEFAPRR